MSDLSYESFPVEIWVVVGIETHGELPKVKVGLYQRYWRRSEVRGRSPFFLRRERDERKGKG